MEETYFWSTLVLAISFSLLLVLFLYKMFISPRQVIVSLEKASSGIFVADVVPADAALERSGKTGQSVNGQAAVGVSRNWGLTLSLAVLSSVLGLVLGWDFVNNVYAQQWVVQNLAEVGLIALAVIMGVILLPLAMILLTGFMGREKKSAAGQYSGNRSKKD
jgi:hypothetical protein